MVCNTCKIDKVDEDFPWRHKDVKRSTKCLSCQREYTNLWYQRNRQQHKANVARINAKLRRDVQTFIYEYLLMHPCVACGQTEPIFLDFDHLGDKSFCVGRLIQRPGSMKRVIKEINKCQVLCANCHRFKTTKDQNWYKYQKYLERNK